MLIIFDLDDTLLDTSGSVIPFKMRICLKKLLEHGASIGEFEKAYLKLMCLNAKSARSVDALKAFADLCGCHDPSEALKELTAPLPEDFLVSTTPYAKEVLSFFYRHCTLALVTVGHPPFQREKMKKAGLELSLFSKIAISEDSGKKPFYQDVAKEFALDPKKVWVCGDRVEGDLLPARELGFHTIHMKWGRGKGVKTPEWVSHSVSALSELRGIIR